METNTNKSYLYTIKCLIWKWRVTAINIYFVIPTSIQLSFNRNYIYRFQLPFFAWRKHLKTWLDWKESKAWMPKYILSQRSPLLFSRRKKNGDYFNFIYGWYLRSVRRLGMLNKIDFILAWWRSRFIPWEQR